MPDRKQPVVDPFADDIVNDPRGIDYSVPGLNEAVADEVVRAVEDLATGKRPRTGARAAKALLALSPRAGFGKSHVIGTTFERLAGRATLVNVRPFEDAETRWKSILMRLVQELSFPERFGTGARSMVSQLELFAHGVMSQAVADLMEEGKGNKRTIAFLRGAGDQPEKLLRNAKWRVYLEKGFTDDRWIGLAAQRIQKAGMQLHASPATWIRILCGYATSADDWDMRQGCIDWIQCDPVDEEAAEALGIRRADRVAADVTPGQQNDLAKGRVLDLFRLAGFFRPFLICFDQSETYGKSQELARSLGTVITDLTDEGSNQVTLITANLDPWEKRLRLHWEQASLDRVAHPPMRLQAIRLQQARMLAAHRLDLLGGDEETVERFWGDREWLERLFKETSEMSVRMFLHACSRRWNEADVEQPAPEPTGLETLFKRYVDEIATQPRRQVFDRDIFYWLAHELAAGVEGITVDKARTRAGESLPRWRHGNREYVFGFESGNHWKRWHKIATTALAGGTGVDRILVYPRTPELPRIPRSTWRVAKPDIDRARRSRLLVLELDRHELVRLYGAQELYADAVQGDIDHAPEEVAGFLREALADFWRAILEWPRGAAGRNPAPEAPAPPSSPAPEGDLERRVVDVIRRRKFLSLEDLLARLPGEPDREAVLGICGEAPRVRVHTSPRMTVLQWQTA